MGCKNIILYHQIKGRISLSTHVSTLWYGHLLFTICCTKYVWNFFFLSLVGRTIVSSVLWVFYTTFPGNYLHGLYHYCFVIGYSDSVCWCYKSMLQIMGMLRLPLHSTKSLPSIPMLNNFAHRPCKIEQGGSVNCNFLSK